MVLIKDKSLDLRELLLKNLKAVVVAAVVGDNDVGERSISACKHRGQVLAQQLGAIPVQYYYRYRFHFSTLIKQI